MATKTEKAAPKAAKTTKADEPKAVKAAPAKAAKPAATKAAGAKPNALQQPLKPSAELGAIVGTAALARGEVVSKV
ncbi:hypothetical protein VWT69_22410, partial [Xanthomonas citri pv. citri]